MPPRKTMRTSYKRTNRTSNWRTKRTYTPSSYYSCSSPKFSPARNECQWRIGSYRNVYSQFTGAGTRTCLSPATASRWMRYINNGVRIYKFNTNQFSRYFGSHWARVSPQTARQYLKRKFGASIKDVTRGKGNCWLIATTKGISGRPFNNYSWT